MRASRIAAVLAALTFGIMSPLGHADGAAVTVSADPALSALLGRVAGHAARFEEMKRRGAFTLAGRLEELDRRGHVDGTKEMVVRVTATPAERVTEFVRYVENGADRTADAARRAPSLGRYRDLHLPFLASEQGRYTFALAERAPADPALVRVTFTPRSAAEDAYKGSAWVDERSGEVLTLGLSPSKNPRFVDHVDVTMRFDLATPLGRAPSNVTLDARGGFLFVRKRYRGAATISDPRLAF